MASRVVCCWGCCLVLVCMSLGRADDQPKRNSKQALQAFNDLIGTWRCTGRPEGSRVDKQRGFWTESMEWQWQFKGDDAWLEFASEKGKHFTSGVLRYLPGKDHFQLTVHTPAKEALVFTGPLRDKQLTVERTDDATKQTHRLVVSLLHSNRFLYRYEVKPADRNLFARLYQVGATKEGVPFAQGDDGPECIVSGGLGTMKVGYNGKSYYVCCSGCRRAFQDEPEKYIKEYEEAKKKKKGQ